MAFLRRVLTLGSGTALAQVIAVASAPMLSRLYSPQDFGLLATYMAMICILSIPATGSYQNAIILPVKENDAASVLMLSLLMAIGVNGILLAILVPTRHFLVASLRQPELSPWLLTVPLAVGATAFAQSFHYWLNRHRNYLQMGAGRIVQACVVAGVSLLAAIVHRGPAGLLLGLLLGSLAYAALLVVVSYRAHPGWLASVSKRRIAEVARRYVDFPKYSAPAELVNMAARHVPVVILAFFFGIETAGLFLLSQRVLATPTQVIALAIADVFKQQASSDVLRYGNCRRTFQSTLALLVAMGLPPLILMTLAGPATFEWLFGVSWRTSGEYTQIMAIWYFVSFVSSPLSRVYVVMERQSFDLAWQILLLCTTVAALAGGAAIGSQYAAIVLLTVGYATMYLVNICFCYAISGARKSALAATENGSAGGL